jgi:lipoprotein signal peptidase
MDFTIEHHRDGKNTDYFIFHVDVFYKVLNSADTFIFTSSASMVLSSPNL